MIQKHKTIQLLEKPIFSLLEITTPMEEALPIPATACFCYVLEGDGQKIDKILGISATKGNVILALCGFTLGSMLSKQENGNLKLLIVHFLPEHLKTTFSDSKPPKWKELDSPVTKYFSQTATNNLIDSYVNGIYNLFSNKDAVTDELLILKLKELFILLLQTENAPNILKLVRSLFSEREFSFREIVDAHLFEPLSIEDLATLLNMSLSTFKREFRRHPNNNVRI